jgi:hypothetical protein
MTDWKELRISKCRTHHVFPDGTELYPQRYLLVYDFSEGFAVVKDKKGWYHITPDGTELYPHRYLWADDFSEGFAGVRDESGFYTIDTKGERACD